MRILNDAARPVRLAFHKLFIALIVLSISTTGLTVLKAQSAGPSTPASQTPANQTDDVRVARISLIQYYVSMMRGDDPDWFDATVNMPVQTGDRLYVGDSGLSELQIGSNLFVRLEATTGLDVLDLSKERSQFRMYSGSLTVNLRSQPTQTIEIDTPSAAVTLSDAGEYRINVLSGKKAEVVVWRGNAEVYDGDEILVRAGHQMVLLTDEKTSYMITDVPEQDAWDQWNQKRDEQLAQEAASLNDIADNQSIEGVEDLTDNGQWINTADYGEVWTPNDVSDDWAPYQDGGWVWRDPCGWTWVSSESWGWAPYHYGTWTCINGRWCWVPGGDRNYSPAQVGFIGYGNGRIGWVPLAPGERSVRRGSAMDRNGVRYGNQNNRNAVSVATKDGFSGGPLMHHNPVVAKKGDAPGRAISGPNVMPTKNSLSPTIDGKAIFARPTPTYFNRAVVVHNNSVPVVRSFDDKVAEIKANGGAPVAAVQKTPTGGTQTQIVTSQPGAANRSNGAATTMQSPNRLVPAGAMEGGQRTTVQSQGNSYSQQNTADRGPRNVQQPQVAVKQQNGEQGSKQVTQPPRGNTYQPQRTASTPERNNQDVQRNAQQQQEQERQEQERQEQERQRAVQQQQDLERQRQHQADQERQRQQQEQQRQEQARQQQQQDQERQRREQEQQQQEQTRQQQQRQQEQQRQQQAEQEHQRQQQEQQRQQQEQQRQQQEQQRQQQEQQRQQQQKKPGGNV